MVYAFHMVNVSSIRCVLFFSAMCAQCTVFFCHVLHLLFSHNKQYRNEEESCLYEMYFLDTSVCLCSCEDKVFYGYCSLL